jgi:hypothetical protein
MRDRVCLVLLAASGLLLAVIWHIIRTTHQTRQDFYLAELMK